MTPKEKAKELICKFEILESPCFNGNTVELEQIGYNTGKKCTLIAVDEILNQLSPLELSPLGTYTNPKINYWKEVKQELENL